MKPLRFSLQTRLAGTFAIVLAILGAGIWLQETRDSEQNEQTRSTLAQEHTILLDKIVRLMGNPLQFFVSDYAPWDDMVGFVNSPEKDWGNTNVHDPLENFKIEAVWVLHADGSLVYAAQRGDGRGLEALKPLPLPPEAVQSLIAQPRTLHCFARTPAGLLEIRVEPIRTAANINRLDAGSGWLVAGELWDAERLGMLASLVNAKISLAPPDAAAADSDPHVLHLALPLPDWNGRPLEALAADFAPPALLNLEEDRVTDLGVFIFCGTAILVTLLLTTYRWLVRPLRLLTTSLAQHDARQLSALAFTSREFDDLGRLIQRSFAQERELRQAFEAFNAIDDAVFIVDAATHGITYVNAGALRLLGRPREQVLAAPLADFLRPETDPANAAPAGPANPLQYARVVREGTELELECRRHTLTPEGPSTHYVVVARDITERRRQEKQRLRAQRLESLGALAGGVAHDLNNMLTPVSLLLDEISDPHNPVPMDLIASVRISVKRAASMLRQLLTFGRGVEGERKPVAIAELCADLGRIINSTFPKAIHLELQVSPDIGDVLGDSTQLHQVLLNLCVNARDAMPDGGVLHILASPLQITPDNLARWPEAQPGNHVLLEVRDTGTGIPPEVVDRIFEPFFTTKTADKGTGLGLSTTLGIVRGHGGSIVVESQPGEGTAFRIALPAVPGRPSAHHDDVAPDFSAGGRTVLVVEDEPLVVRTLLALLLQSGWKVVTASDGAAGLATFKVHRADIALVLSDISMAGIDGLEMLRQLKELAPEIPLVVMSGRIDERQQLRMNELKLRHIVHKPFTRTELLAVLRQALAAY